VNEIGRYPGAWPARAALMVVILAITAGAVPASALTPRDSRVVVSGPPSTRLEGWQRRTVNPRVQAPQSAAGPSTLGPVSPFSGFGSSLVGSAPVGTGPSTLAINPATHTIYVANGFNDNGWQLPTPGNTVSVINAHDCQAQDVSRCDGPWPTITVGNMPSGIAIDKRTDTVYVSNVQDNTVSVFNGATCNAETTSGCGQTPATVPVGLDPLGLFADPANRTVYVPDYGASAVGGPQDSTSVSMLDSATCNATDLAGCPTTPPPTVDVKASPDDVAVDPATHTVYVTTVSNGNPGSNSGWTVFDANTCNATTQAGCGQLGMLPGDQIGPNAAQIDPANNTLYTANFDNTVSAFDLHRCNAGDLAGCASDAPGTVTVPAAGFDHALWLTVDAPLHSVYVVYQKDDALKVIDTNLCSGSKPAGCAKLTPPEIHTGADPESVILDPLTQTLYTANWVDNNVSVIDANRCDAQNTGGCRHRPPAVTIPGGAGALATDPAAHTTYVVSGSNTVSMINTRICNADRPTGCAQIPPQVTVGDHPMGVGGVAIDRRTHTVYVANSGSGATGTVSVLDDRSCNATDSAGCASVSTLQVPGGNPDDIAVNPATGTVYVATITSGGPNLISVFNGATCNATVTAGCGQTPATIMFGDSGAGNGGSFAYLAVDHATNTIYATNVVQGHPFGGDSVYVIDGATCDATDRTGCGQTPATVTLGSDPLGIAYNPSGIAVDPATDTIYTANIADGEGPGTVSVINGANCNGHNTNGCSQTPATAPAGFGANGIAVDRTTHEVYVTNTEDTSVSVIDGTKCNGTDTSGCSHTPAKDSVGGYPGSIAIDPAVRTAYVQTLDGVSVIPLTH
jgi:DNA-binding beta-propeller fold protein YncE